MSGASPEAKAVKETFVVPGQTIALVGAATIPGAKYVLLPNVDHFALLQDPDGFNRSVLDFLKQGAAQTVEDPTP